MGWMTQRGTSFDVDIKNMGVQAISMRPWQVMGTEFVRRLAAALRRNA
ncbi:hypothetical protein [Oceanospirillum sediminis]|uniref:Uncharacterized protein n=1 Tax=Oceanospirillum sediminis TaxID=2760088 RepID=A0A839IV80_9GAMM|nr:hypothetical protein [Oceanospirillum sediminis]MBB1488327.1 hypothetical protein [Oceanospirillum sediminis]